MSDFDTREAAENIIRELTRYNECDPEEVKKETDNIEQALYELKLIAGNSNNADYWRSLVAALAEMFNN